MWAQLRGPSFYPSEPYSSSYSLRHHTPRHHFTVIWWVSQMTSHLSLTYNFTHLYTYKKIINIFSIQYQSFQQKFRNIFTKIYLGRHVPPHLKNKYSLFAVAPFLIEEIGQVFHDWFWVKLYELFTGNLLKKITTI